MQARLAMTVSGLAIAVAGIVHAQSQQVETHDYDELGRLIATDTTGSNPNQTRSTCYDEAGNRLAYRTDVNGVRVICNAPAPSPTPSPTPTPTAAPTLSPAGSNNPPVTSSVAVSGNCLETTFYDIVSAHVSDPDGHAISLVEIVKVSGLGNSMATAYQDMAQIDFGTHVNRIDNFTYTVKDSLGATAMDNLSVTVTACQSL